MDRPLVTSSYLIKGDQTLSAVRPELSGPHDLGRVAPLGRWYPVPYPARDVLSPATTRPGAVVGEIDFKNGDAKTPAHPPSENFSPDPLTELRGRCHWCQRWRYLNANGFCEGCEP